MASAALTADLNARLANFKKGMDQANKQLDKLNSTAHKVQKTFAGLTRSFVGLFTVAATKALVRQTTEWALELENAARVAGITTDALQALREQAKLFGNDIAQTDDALRTFAENIGDVRLGGRKGLAEILERYNIALEESDGSMRSVTDILEDYAKAHSNAADQTEKNILATEAFGDNGIRLAEALGDMENGIAGVVEQQKEFGKVVDERAIAGLTSAAKRFSEEASIALSYVRTELGLTAAGIQDLWNAVTNNEPEVTDAFDNIKDSVEGVKEASLDFGWVPPIDALTAAALAAETGLERVIKLFDDGDTKADELLKRIEKIGRPELFAEGLGEPGTGLAGLDSIKALIASDDIVKAREQITAMAGALEDLSANADDALKQERVRFLRDQLATLTEQAPTPARLAQGVTTTLVEQVEKDHAEAQGFLNQNPLSAPVVGEVQQSPIARAVDQEGFKGE